MTAPIRYLSVCSGIEAATVAWKPLGWEPVAFSEIERFPSAVLGHYYPNVPNWGDMTGFKEWPDADVDVLVGGTPCQSFSVAGLRKGLADPRGNLALTYLAIADRYRPKWLVWENVPGVLSSNEGRDFGAFFGALGELGYGFAYRVLDAQYFGLAQRRRRVFVVGNLGDWRRAAAVLFERESLQGHPEPRRKTGETSPTPPARTSGGGGFGTDFDVDGGLIAGTVSAKWAKGTGGPAGDECQNLVVHTLRGDGVDASEDGTGRGTPLVPVAFDPDQITSPDNHSNPKPGDPCPTLFASGKALAIAFNGREDLVSGNVPGALGTSSPQAQCVAYDLRGRAEGARFEGPHDTANIRAADGGSSRSYIFNGWAVRRLTPTECERLQGFPDGYTLIRYRGKTAADSPRYKALGNSMAVPVMAWIGERIDRVMRGWPVEGGA